MKKNAIFVKIATNRIIIERKVGEREKVSKPGNRQYDSMNNKGKSMQNTNSFSREAALRTIAIEIDKSLRIGPVTHIKHIAVPNGQHGLACLESHLLGNKDGELYSLHAWGNYDTIKATSLVIPTSPRGFTVTLKTDSPAENALRENTHASIPQEAKTQNYTGDYIKIDWIYPCQEIQGLGIPRHYFYAVERGAKAVGYPSLHIDATNNGLSYWARKEFGLKIPEENHEMLREIYQCFKANTHSYIQYACSVSPYITTEYKETLPENIDPSEPHSIPRIFMDILGAIFMLKKGHLHFYKKFN